MFIYPNSSLIKIILLLRGIEVGKNFYIQGIPFLKIRGFAKNIKIGDNVIIGAGSVVVKDVPSNCVIAGNPASIKKYL